MNHWECYQSNKSTKGGIDKRLRNLMKRKRVKFDERYSGMGNRLKLCSANGTVRGHFDGKNSHIKRKGGV